MTNDSEFKPSSSASAQGPSEEIEKQHLALRGMLAEIIGSLEKMSENMGLIDRQISELARELQWHFQEEEDGGFFSQISQRAPQLLQESSQVEHQHQGLRAQLQKLQAMTDSFTGSDSQGQHLKVEFHDFSKKLMHHESQENQLLQRSYNEDIGSHD